MKIDVIINVYGKPLQTGLSLMSLMKHSGKWIDRIYFQQEPEVPPFEVGLPEHNPISFYRDRAREYFSDRIIHFRPKHFNFTMRSNATRLARDAAYRLSMRYQHGFENSDKDFALLLHNDVLVTDDVAGAMLESIGEHAGVGVIGTCEICPAHHLGKCDRSAYSEYRPNFKELEALYKAFEGNPNYLRRYDFFNSDFRQRPWPLPECRLCEWACLINLKKTRKRTMPFGSGMPIGTYPSGGSSNLDIGAAWFRDMNAMGLAFKHFDLGGYVEHNHGHMTLCDARLHYYQEYRALKTLEREYPEFLNKSVNRTEPVYVPQIAKAAEYRTWG